MIEFYNESVNLFCERNSTNEADYLHQLERQTHLSIRMPQMISGKLQGRVLSMLSKLRQPRYILEIGTFTGYSALCLAEGLQADGELHTIDSNDQYEEIIAKYLMQTEYESQIHFHRGLALEILPTLNKNWDLIFIDADKAEYLAYLKMLEPNLAVGTLLISDNILWHGKIFDEKKDLETQTLLDYSNYLKDSELWETVILTVRDGISVSRKIK